MKAMKKLLYFFLAMLATSFTLTACGDDDDNDSPANFTQSAEQAAAGVYQGYYTRQQAGTTTIDTADGSAEIIADSAYCADFHFTSTRFNLDAQSVANIAHADQGFVFSNNVSANGLGGSWAGRIDAAGTMSVTFQLRQRVGRRTRTYNYTFVGSRVVN